MDIAIILAAFGLGFVAAAVNLPPLVGYLAAGFALHAFGYESSDAIEYVADLGVLLLLFGIGLKLRLSTFTRPEVWAGATMHMALTTAVLGAVFLGLGAAGLPLAAGLSLDQALLVGFALSFSSTVFAVKALEERNESSSLPGRIAIGILVVQDIFAVVYLTLAVDTAPSWWAIPVVIVVVAARPVYGWILDRSGHGELLVLLGFALAVGVGAEAFSEVGLKADLGALVIGITLANHRRSPELADTLLGYKDVLLVGFFLSIGLGGAPGPAAFAVAAVALVLLPLKTGGYMAMLMRFRLRSRTAWHTSITLADFSEFGLIVAAVGVERGTLDQQWASAIALAVAVSFAIAAPANTARYLLFRRMSGWLTSRERSPVRPDDALIDPGPARLIVFGMGRVGAGAYDELVRREGDTVLGIDRRDDTVAENLGAGRRVVRGDVLDNDFWDRVRFGSHVDLVVLAMSDHQANLEAVRRVRAFLPDVRIAASALHHDEVLELEHAGVDVARNLYGEAGQGLADDACDLLDLENPP
ncbi:MAG TPA: cation:proton antiporter family protein [Acidimicrobiia bacterium]|nr:cation:proton antiporter family protein [Acidimicrobiia bacterium]